MILGVKSVTGCEECYWVLLGVKSLLGITEREELLKIPSPKFGV